MITTSDRSHCNAGLKPGVRLSRVPVVSLAALLAAPALLAQTAPALSAQAPPAGSASTQNSAVAPGSAAAPLRADNIAIAPGDLLDVEVFNTPELSGRLRVDQTGRVTLPLAGTVEVKGMTVSAAAAAITERFRSTQIMLAPSVSVAVLEYATEGVTVVGEVRNPGIYTLLGPHSLYDAVASAGGASSSEGSDITITHAGDAEHPIRIPVTTPDYSAVEKATMISPGDTVVVSRAALVYIVGDVSHSGAFYMQNGQKLTVLNLLSLAQGANRTAAMSHAALIRATPGGVKTIPFNLNKVMKNQEENLVLQAGDVMVLPRSGWKDFTMEALPGLTNAVSAAASTALITH